MRSLREFAQFVGRPQQPISPRILADYLRLNINPNAVSVREIIQAFEGSSQPVAIDAIEVLPSDAIVPFEVSLYVTRLKGYVFNVRWRILRSGQQVAVYDFLHPRSFNGAHTFTEPDTYTVELTVKGIGKDGYAEATKSVTVVAKPKVVKPPPESNRLKLVLGATELVPNTLRITSVDWKVIPVWNPAQVFNLTGAEAEVTLPNPPSSERRVRVEPRIRCAVAGVLDGVVFQFQEFEGRVDPFPAIVGLEGKPLTAGWTPFWTLVIVGDNDDNPNNNPVAVDVVAKLINIS
jgi:hypothetical protein